MARFKDLMHTYFNLDSDRDDEAAIVTSITRNIHFKGANLWTLIFAIIIASIGLNVNSTAVIIGAMLISPLMGPIMGIGLGIGINDFDIVRKGLKNLLVATVFSIATSALYFYFTPLHTATSELLARTTPTIWDVIIAFTGGLAGIIAGTRSEKSNVIPGVAIATALMPPLCTAGYGIASGNIYYFLGAIYLFFINSVFICIATFLIIRYLRFHKREFQDPARKQRMTRYILLVVVITVAPSIWLAYRIVQKAVFENAAQNYIRKEFNFTNTQVVNKNLVFDTGHPRIELLLIGQQLDSLHIDTLKRRLNDYNLSTTQLVIRQGLNARQEIDFAQVKASIMDEVFSKQTDTAKTVVPVPTLSDTLSDIHSELHALFPSVTSYSLSKIVYARMDSVVNKDSILLLIANSPVALSGAEQQRMQRWMTAKYSRDSVQIIFRRGR